jgi:hypothetical protein
VNKLLAILVFGLTACNYDVGECWVRGQGADGAGGVIITQQTGVGGFGQVPLEPQDASDFADPCSSQTVQCTVTWKAGSAVCKESGAAASCTSVYQGEHATLDEAKERCEEIYGVGKDSGAQSCGPCQVAMGATDERCKKLCDKIYDKCMDKCKDSKCRNECFQDYVECLRDCDR